MTNTPLAARRLSWTFVMPEMMLSSCKSENNVCKLEGLSILPFSIGTRKKIEGLLPPLAIRTNPVDMGPAWYDSQVIKGIVEAVLKDKEIDALVLCVMFTSANRAAAGALADLLLQTRKHKPVICCFSAPLKIWDEEIKRLEASGIPSYPTPERAAKTLANLIRFNKLLRHPPYCSQEKSEPGIEGGKN